MAAFGSSDGSTQGAAAAGAMEWDLDVDAFLDDYLKDLGPEAQGPDHFGNIAIDFAPAGGPPPGAVLGAWGPAAPAASMPVDSAQQTPTLLTEPLAAAGLHSQHTAAAQRDSGGEAVQQAAPAGRATRGRKTAGGPAASGGSRETKKELDLKKHLALQEKNRRAQRRFRERQKQRVAELEEQVATLQAQLAAASGGQAAPVRVAPTAMQQDVKCEPQASPRAVVGAPTTSGPPSDEEPAMAVSFNDALTLTVAEGRPVQLSARQLADMTPAELAKYYKAYVNELAGILVESDNPDSQVTQERVRRLVDEVCLLSTRAALCNPPGSKHFALTKVDDVPGQPADARVPQIARALNVTHHQRKQLGQLRGLFLQKLGRIAGDRRDINAQLAGAVPGGTGNRHLCARYLTAHDSARRLRESLREEHILVLDFISTIYKHVFACQQVAQFMIQSYPWTPDCLALCTWVAAEDGDAEALSMLAADAQSKQQAAVAAAASGAAPAGAASSRHQTSSGASGGNSGNTLLQCGGAATPRGGAGAGMGPPPPPMFLPTAFAMPAGMQQQSGMFQQMTPPGIMPAQGGYNPAAALMHAPTGSDGMAGTHLMGHRWVAGAAPPPGGLHQPITAAGSGCLQLPLGLPHLAAPCGGAASGAPISPHVATMSSGNDHLQREKEEQLMEQQAHGKEGQHQAEAAAERSAEEPASGEHVWQREGGPPGVAGNAGAKGEQFEDEWPNPNEPE